MGYRLAKTDSQYELNAHRGQADLKTKDITVPEAYLSLKIVLGFLFFDRVLWNFIRCWYFTATYWICTTAASVENRVGYFMELVINWSMNMLWKFNSGGRKNWCCWIWNRTFQQWLSQSTYQVNIFWRPQPPMGRSDDYKYHSYIAISIICAECWSCVYMQYL